MQFPADKLLRFLAPPDAGRVWLLLAAVLIAPNLHAATFNVTKTADTNDGTCDADCSLREAVIAANALPNPDTINVPAGNYILTIAGVEADALQGDLDILQPVDIIGAGAASTIIDGGALDSVFEIFPSTVSISSVTIRNGLASSNGGGLVNRSGANLVLNDLIVSDNVAGNRAGGLYAIGSATTTINRSTFSGNTSQNEGGGLSLNGTADLTNVTISGNSTGGSGGGITNRAVTTLTNVTLNLNEADTLGGGGVGSNLYDPGVGSYSLTNVIVANGIGPSNCQITTLIGDVNNLDSGNSCGFAGPLVNSDPLLGALQDNGGPTWTHALLAGSPAIDAGTNSGCPGTDQRGVARPIDGDGDLIATCDVGAYEAGAQPGSIAGTVFIDSVGDGLADGPVGGANNPSAAGVSVYLYADDGGSPNVPDATDTALNGGLPISTGASGDYLFAGLTNGVYWVVVDSKTLSADANVWGEQTYGPVGGWCADGAGGTVQGIGTAGVCYGGRHVDPVPANPSSDDLTTWHTGADHVGEITVAGGGDVTNVDFGFSFNVVTTTRGGDATDDDGLNPRTVQGSLRQFIQNANAIAGANAMRFVPAEPANASGGGHSWWQIFTSSALPLIAGATTTIDGAAYEFSDGTTLRDTNTAAIGSGAAVGVSGTFNTPQLDPELELRGDAVVTIGLQLQPTADNSAIRNLVINAFAINAVRLIGTLPDDLDGATLENTVIGTSPISFTDNPALSTGRALFSRDLSNATIRNNLAGWLDWGFQIQFDTFDSLIETNEIRNCSVHALYAAGNAGTGQQPARITIRGNLFESNGSDAINTFHSLNQFTITENTLRLSGSDGVHLYPTQSTITSNVITDNGGAGLLIAGNNLPTFPAVSQTRISQNHFGNNGQLAIDLVASGTAVDGITFNDDLDGDSGGANELHNFPVIQSAVLAGGNLTVTGYARPGVDLEFYESVGAVNDQNGGGTAHGEGIDYLFTVTEGSGADTDSSTDSYASPHYGSDSAAARFRFVVAAPAGLTLSEELSAISIDTTNDTSEFGPNAVVAAPYSIIKRAFLPDGTPVGDGSSVPVGVEFKFLLYINNKNGATNDATIRDVLDPLFAYQTGTVQVDNSVGECAAAACTPAEEAAIFAAAIAAPVLTDGVDADVASYNGTDTVDAGNQFVANGQLNITADSVLAVAFSAKIQ